MKKERKSGNEMVDRVKIIINENHPWYAIAVGSYDIRSGIKVPIIWSFVEPKKFTNVEDLFKITLGNVHRQANQYFTTFPCERIDIKDKNLVMFTSSYLIPQQNRMNCQSLAFFLRGDMVMRNPYINAIIYDQVQPLAMKIKKLIQSDENLLQITDIIREVSITIQQILKAGIISFPITNLISNYDTAFLTKALSSHLQTQMTTIIEASDFDECSLVFSLISNFLLPEQLKLSSDLINEEPIPGLFLQIVSPQNNTQLPYNILLQFSRPWTWINMHKMQIWQSPNLVDHHQHFVKYRDSIKNIPEMTENQKKQTFSRIVRSYSRYEPSITSWSVDIIKHIIRLPKSFVRQYCEQKLAELVHKSVILIELVEDIMIDGKVKFLGVEHKAQISQLLNISGKDDLASLASLANVIDSSIFKKVYNGRNEVFKQMLVTV